MLTLECVSKYTPVAEGELRPLEFPSKLLGPLWFHSAWLLSNSANYSHPLIGDLNLDKETPIRVDI